MRPNALFIGRTQPELLLLGFALRTRSERMRAPGSYPMNLGRRVTTNNFTCGDHFAYKCLALAVPTLEVLSLLSWRMPAQCGQRLLWAS